MSRKLINVEICRAQNYPPTVKREQEEAHRPPNPALNLINLTGKAKRELSANSETGTEERLLGRLIRH